MICLIDDDKFHYESHPTNNKLFNVKIMKHVRDNRWGLVMDVFGMDNKHLNEAMKKCFGVILTDMADIVA